MNTIRSLFATLLCTAVSILTIAHAAASSEVRYQIDITEPAHHIAHITATFPRTDAETLDVMMPVWRPGKYKILDLSGGMIRFKASNGKGQPLRATKIDKTTWRIEQGSAQAIQVEYDLYANQLDSRTRHIDDSHAFLDLVSVLVYAEQYRELPARVSLNVPKGWQSRSGMEKQGGKHSFIAANYDILIDSPIETGIHSYHAFKVDGKKHELVVWGEGNQDESKIIEDLKKIAASCGDIWGSYPFERYVWMLHVNDKVNSGTEHINSTIMQSLRYSFKPREDYLKFLSLAAHEFIHTWNVKGYRPQGIYKYNYREENYTPLLWLSEGSTSYFAPFILARGEAITGKEFLGSWAKAINTYLKTPGHEITSATEASFNAWTGESDDWMNNTGVSFYNQGMIASLVLDTEIRKHTNGKKGYENVHRLLYERYPLSKSGFTEDDVLALLNEVSGKDMHSTWDNYVQGTHPIDFDRILKSVGLEMSYQDKENKSSVWSGIIVKKDKQYAPVTRVLRNSPAWKAGLTSGDTIIAINKKSVAGSNFGSRLKNFEAGDKITLSYFRRSQLYSTELTLENKLGEKLKITPVKKPTQKQKKAFEAWSGIQWASLSKAK